MEQQQQITIIGSYNVGFFLKGAQIPAVGQTLIGDTFTEGGGGKGSNQAIAAAKLGGNTTFVGCIGSDKYGQDALKLYQNYHIADALIRLDDSTHTGISVIFIDGQGRNSIMVVPGANYNLCAGDIDAAEAAIEQSFIVGFQLENQLDVVSYGLKKAHNMGVRTLLDPAPAQKLPDSLYQYITILKPNEHEATTLSGIAVTDVQSAVQAGRWFNQKGVPVVIITLGEQGAVLVENGRDRFFKPLLVDAVDTTGAGDCFSGALMAALAQGQDTGDAICFAQTAAALSATRFGVVGAIPERGEVMARLAAEEIC